MNGDAVSRSTLFISYFIFFVHISSCGSVIFTVLFGTFFESNVLYGCILHVN